MGVTVVVLVGGGVTVVVVVVPVGGGVTVVVVAPPSMMRGCVVAWRPWR